MKNSSRILSALFFILLLAMPLQVFADEKGGKHSHGEEKTKTNEEINKEESHDESDDHGHGEGDDHGHGESDDHGHGEADDHGQGESDDHVGEADDHGHGEGDDHGDDEGHEGDDHGDDGHGGGGHGDDGHGKSYEEIGPNYPVLGTFAAINGGFLLFGAIRKISSNRRKRGVQ